MQVAKNFMKGCGSACTLLTIKTKTAADISEITFYGNEKETATLLPALRDIAARMFETLAARRVCLLRERS